MVAEQAIPAIAVAGVSPVTGDAPLRGKRNIAQRVEQRGCAQYATGRGSSERHMYHVATLRQGAQAWATSRTSLRLTGSPEK